MDISNFIEIVHAYTSIWNVSSKEYRNKTYNEIAGSRKRVRSYLLPEIYTTMIKMLR